MSAGRAVFVVGAGGHGKVVVSTLQEAGFRPECIYDDDPATWGKSILGVRVAGSPAELLGRRPSGPAVVAIGGNPARRAVAERLHGLEWITVVHPSAVVHRTVKLGPGTVVFAGAVIQADTTLGDHCIVNTGATLDHDCRVGSYTHLAPGTHVAGGVSLGEGVLLGIGAVALPGTTIGAGTVVGAGAVVTKDLPAGVTAVGAPARPIREREEGWHDH
jgi:UDP-perosamine 4-acetyltransferase